MTSMRLHKMLAVLCTRGSPEVPARPVTRATSSSEPHSSTAFLSSRFPSDGILHASAQQKTDSPLCIVGTVFGKYHYEEYISRLALGQPVNEICWITDSVCNQLAGLRRAGMGIVRRAMQRTNECIGASEGSCKHFFVVAGDVGDRACQPMTEEWRQQRVVAGAVAPPRCRRAECQHRLQACNPLPIYPTLQPCRLNCLQISQEAWTHAEME